MDGTEDVGDGIRLTGGCTDSLTSESAWRNGRSRVSAPWGMRSCNNKSAAWISGARWKRWRIAPSCTALAKATSDMP